MLVRFHLAPRGTRSFGCFVLGELQFYASVEANKAR